MDTISHSTRLRAPDIPNEKPEAKPLLDLIKAKYKSFCNYVKWDLIHKNIHRITHSRIIPIPLYLWPRFFKRLRHLVNEFALDREMRRIHKHSENASIWGLKKAQQRERQENRFTSLNSQMAGLHKTMQLKENVDCVNASSSRTAIKFKGLFCRIVRENMCLSRKQLCMLINAHHDISRMDRYAWNNFYKLLPISEEFLEAFEDGKIEHKLMDMTYDDASELRGKGGFAIDCSGQGFPYDIFVEMIAKICCVHRDQDEGNQTQSPLLQFQAWLLDYHLSVPSIYEQRRTTEAPENCPTVQVDFKKIRTDLEASRNDD